METITIPSQNANAEELILPSLGLSHGIKKIYMRPIAFKDETLLTSKTATKGGNVHDMIVRECILYGKDENDNIIEKDDIDTGVLFTEDEYVLFLFLRAISYGVDYEPEYKCPSCEKKHALFVNLETDLPIKYLKDDVNQSIEGTKDYFDVLLPVSKKKVKLRYPRKADSDGIENPMLLVPVLVTEIEGVDYSFKDMWIQEMIGKDSAELRNALKDIPFGADKDVIFTCKTKDCDLEGVEQEITLPITAEFFRI
jgi:hypothetical protein